MRTGVKARSRFVFYSTKEQREKTTTELEEGNPFKTVTVTLQCRLIKRSKAVYSFVPPPSKPVESEGEETPTQNEDTKTRAAYCDTDRKVQ